MVAEALLSDRVQFDEEQIVLPSNRVLSAAVRDSVLGSKLYRFSRGIWERFRCFGLPHGGGWSNERLLVVRLLELWEHERVTEEHRRLTMIQEKRSESKRVRTQKYVH